MKVCLNLFFIKNKFLFYPTVWIKGNLVVCCLFVVFFFASFLHFWLLECLFSSFFLCFSFYVFFCKQVMNCRSEKMFTRCYDKIYHVNFLPWWKTSPSNFSPFMYTLSDSPSVVTQKWFQCEFWSMYTSLASTLQTKIMSRLSF